MLKIIYLLSLLCSLTISSPLPEKENNNKTSSLFYDQRQTGKYNINLNIKDVAIITLDSENLSSDIGVSLFLFKSFLILI